jgi:hypothetical protein
MTPDPKTETDRDLDEMNTQILVIARKLKEIFGEDIKFAIMKLEAASRDIHSLRIKRLLNDDLNGI